MSRSTGWALAMLLAAAAAGEADGGSVSEADLKAAFIYNFAKFVDWPQGAGGPDFVIGVAGSRTLESALRQLTKDRTVHSQPVLVRWIESERDVSSCRLLFAAAGTAEIVSSVRGAPILTVSDAPDFLARGGIIELGLAGNKMSFSINLDAARTAGLAVSSRLLRLAASVKGRY